MSTFAEVAAEMLARFPSRTTCKFLPTNSYILDLTWGGGLPVGKMVQIFSKPGVGKSTTVLHICQAICSAGGNAVYGDIEHALDDSLLKGVDILKFKGKNFMPHQFKTFSDADDFLKSYITAGVNVVVLDSVTALLPSKLQEKDVESIEPGLQARLTSNLLMKYKAAISENGVTLILINQTRTKINMKGPTTTGQAGGVALEFYSDVITEMRRVSWIEGKDKDNKIGVNACIQCTKCKVSHPFVERELPILFGKGVSNVMSLAQLLVEGNKFRDVPGIVKQAGSYFILPDLKNPSNTESLQKVLGHVGLSDWIKNNMEDVVKLLRDKLILQ